MTEPKRPGIVRRIRRARANKKPIPLRLIIFVAVFAVLFLAGTTVKEHHLTALSEWITNLGALGPVVFVAIYVVITPLGAPVSVLTALAGGLFGPWVGVPTTIVASTLSAMVGFFISRYLLREQVTQWVGNKPGFHKLNKMLERNGEMVISLTRLVPVLPFMMLNYAFALTEVHFRKFLLWTFLGMIPVNLFYAVGAGAIRQGIEEGRVPWGAIFLLLGVGVCLIVLVLFARKKLGEGEEEQLIAEVVDEETGETTTVVLEETTKDAE